MSFALDLNVLVYSSDEDSPLKTRAAAFLARCTDGTDPFYLAWPTILGYLRIATDPRIFRRPLAPAVAISNVRRLLDLPQVRTLSEAEGFWEIYEELAGPLAPRGKLVADLHLAALLRQHGIGTLYTRDRDFRRFEFLTVIDPFV